MVLLGKEVFLSFLNTEISKAVVAFLASFYLLDMDYPASYVIPLSVLQKIIFQDSQVHPSYQDDILKALDEFERFNV